MHMQGGKVVKCFGMLAETFSKHKAASKRAWSVGLSLSSLLTPAVSNNMIDLFPPSKFRRNAINFKLVNAQLSLCLSVD